MTIELKAKLKKLYYKSKYFIQSIFIPYEYKYEIKFVENIRANTYSDISYKEAKLKSITHQLDKTLTLPVFKEMSQLINTIKKMANNIETNPKHDTALISWCNNIIAEYNNRSAGNQATGVENHAFDSHAVEALKRVIETRRSIRSFKPEKISREVLNEILEAGLWAPSGCNRQSIKYLILDNKDDIKYCQKIAGEGYSFPQEASYAVVILADPRNYALPSQRHMAYLEGGAAIQNILLMAHCLGVGSCWLFWRGGEAGHQEFMEKFKLAPWLLPVSMVCLGYPHMKPKHCPVRNTLNKAIHESPGS